jgi:hypothetical protein
MTDPILRRVTSPSEIAECWCYSLRHVQRMADEGKLKGRMSGGRWIITVASVVNLWGPPKKPLPDNLCRVRGSQNRKHVP